MSHFGGATEKINIEKILNISYFEFGKNFTHSPETHEFWEVVYVDSGNIIAITDEGEKKLSQGQVIFHAPGETHAHISDGSAPNTMLVVYIDSESEKMKFFEKRIFTLDKSEKALLGLFVSEAKNAFGKISDEYEEEKPLDFTNAGFGAEQLLECYFTEFLISVVRKNSAAKKTVTKEENRANEKNAFLETIIEYMKENIYAEMGLSSFCSHFMLGKSQLAHIFKEATGKGMMEYYNELKIAEAKKLLKSENLSVSQIADMLKFSCIHSFSRAFKKTVGMSPTMYKKKIL